MDWTFKKLLTPLLLTGLLVSAMPAVGLAAGSSGKQVKKLQKDVKSLKKQLKEVKSQVGALKSVQQQLSSTVESIQKANSSSAGLEVADKSQYGTKEAAGKALTLDENGVVPWNAMPFEYTRYDVVKQDSGFAVAQCESGEVALGGGSASTSAGAAPITQSMPVDSSMSLTGLLSAKSSGTIPLPNSWVSETLDNDSPVHSFVLCAKFRENPFQNSVIK